MMFKEYLQSLENKHGGAVIAINQRLKYKDWSPMVTMYNSTKYFDGLSEITYYTEDIYLKAFHENKIFNSVCYDCKFAKIPRQGDISLGDFYGLGILFKFKDSCKSGVSQILVNNEKGNILFKIIQEEIISYRRPLEEALFYNKNIWNSTIKPKVRDEIMHAYAEKGFDYVAKTYLKKSGKEICIITVKKLIRKVLNDKILLKLMLLLNRKTNHSKMNLIKEYVKGLDNDS